jgi:hypothetical protein
MKDIKIRLDEDEIGLLDDLIKKIRSSLKMKVSRASVVKSCFQHGWLEVWENYATSDATLKSHIQQDSTI